ADIQKAYDAAKDKDYNLPKRYTLSEVLLRTDVPGTDKAAVKAKADQVAAQAASGADFAQLARTWSEDLTASSGGNLGQRTAQQLDSTEVAAAEAAGPGKTTPAFETSRGYAVLQVNAIDDARVIPFEEAQKTIATSMLRSAKVGDVQRAYATKILDA